MEYPIEAFEVLVQEVERQGGALLPDRCAPQDVEYTVPPYASPSKQEGITCGCGNSTKLVSVYDPRIKQRQGGSGFATTCAVCDNMGVWPRYCGAVYAVDPELNPAHWDAPEDDDAN